MVGCCLHVPFFKPPLCVCTQLTDLQSVRCLKDWCLNYVSKVKLSQSSKYITNDAVLRQWDEALKMSAEAFTYFLTQIKSTTSIICPGKKHARSVQLSHNKRHLPSGNRFAMFVARPSFFVPGRHGNKCWRQIIRVNTHVRTCALTLISPEVGNFRPLHVHYLAWPLTPYSWPFAWPGLFYSGDVTCQWLCWRSCFFLEFLAGEASKRISVGVERDEAGLSLFPTWLRKKGEKKPQ